MKHFSSLSGLFHYIFLLTIVIDTLLVMIYENGMFLFIYLILFQVILKCVLKVA